MQDILVFGAGLVAGPLVHYLLDQGYGVRVASRTLSKAESLVGGRPHGDAVQFDITEDQDMLDDLVAQADLAVSLLPYVHHVRVAKTCIDHQTPMVTTSYVSDRMRALDQDARDADVILLNEVGLDPGIDHMSAMRIIDRVHDEGGEIQAFRSFCGGLPAPEANDNPLGYKFSWSPRGVLLAGRNDARYVQNGRIVEVPNERLFATHYVTKIEGLGDLEAYPNRNSLPYIDRYGIHETNTMYRGTLRNLGWCDVMQKLNDLGYFSVDEHPGLADKTFQQVMTERLKKDTTANLKGDLARQLNVAPNSGVMMTLEWLGLMEDEPVSKTTLLDALASRMLDKMQYGEGERDMVVLVHEFLAVYEDREERITSTLIDFGQPDGATSMARLVGSPAAVGVRMILEGKINLSGVRIPVVQEIYEPILKELRRLGISFEETVD